MQLLTALLYIDHRPVVDRIRNFPFASLFTLAAKRPPLVEVAASARRKTPNSEWPSPATRFLSDAPEVWTLVDQALEYAGRLSITKGESVVQAVAFALQTAQVHEPQLKQQNDQYLRREIGRARLALQIPPSVPAVNGSTPTIPTEAVRLAFADAAGREDESPGGYRVTESNSAEVWFASNIGPSSASVRENQDAAWAEAVDDHIVFALADGVGTSFGSRFAAVTNVRAAVRYLVEHVTSCPDSRVAREDLLRKAADSARQAIHECLEYARGAQDAKFSALVRGRENLPEASVQRLMDNTIDRRIPTIGPVFASTLVTGLVTMLPRGGAALHVLRIGDGVAERWRSRQAVKSLLVVDHEETVISGAVCPGRIGTESVSRAEFETEALETGDHVFISSDGLTRGHNQTVVEFLYNLIPGAFTCLPGENSASSILKAAVAAADERATREGEGGLFEDNLALIRVKIGKN